MKRNPLCPAVDSGVFDWMRKTGNSSLKMLCGLLSRLTEWQQEGLSARKTW